jgi:hypothetical protein
MLGKVRVKNMRKWYSKCTWLYYEKFNPGYKLDTYEGIPGRHLYFMQRAGAVRIDSRCQLIEFQA